ncbi:GPP34 family phosphoprotein [Streptomyces sp. NBC_00083]|uniref:GPP34 family phosphoprotein n=1 Tax=Streptomyces sp. NBC_00083 TaxID=2975647 RepID=UPI0022593F15|nr:GPP34 family phosphoprotein [Streptomyces sp. NBC_00083]MCX5388360.1 GPP34 family phosphoprotein [Streptomyces sp. NBC_00083]
MPLTDEAMLRVAGVTGGRAGAWHLELGRVLAGAVLVDLARGGRIAVHAGRVSVLAPAPGAGPVGDAVQGEALDRLARGRRPLTVAACVERLAPSTFPAVERSLVDRGELVWLRGPLGGRGRLLPRDGHRGDPALRPALRELLRAARPAWEPAPDGPGGADPAGAWPAADPVAVVSRAVASCVAVLHSRVMCGF